MPNSKCQTDNKNEGLVVWRFCLWYSTRWSWIRAGCARSLSFYLHYYITAFIEQDVCLSFKMAIHSSVTGCFTSLVQLNNFKMSRFYLIASCLLILACVCPDERALVMAARRLGYVFTTRTPDYIIIEVVRELGENGPKKIQIILCGLRNSQILKFSNQPIRAPDRQPPKYCLK